MSTAAQPAQFSIGWDVGGWNCEKNRKSRDALAVLNASGREIGAPWRGNLRECINDSRNAPEFCSAVLNFCKIDPKSAGVPISARNRHASEAITLRQSGQE
ncbi:MAG: hypothetical protein ACREHV_08650 [Rhizomicrobium sp.]